MRLVPLLDEATQARIAAETATGIAYLHMRDVSIVHGDMKAGNVLLTKRRAVRICDFGMSEVKDRSKTMNVSAAGTPTVLFIAYSVELLRAAA
jgi:serine/threonine protein kinase